MSIEDFFLLTNVRPKHTGLPMNIWISHKGHAHHGARLKVQMNHKRQFDIDAMAAVSIGDDPKIVHGELSATDFSAVKRFIALNRSRLIAHWHGRTSSDEMLDAIRPVPS